MNLWEAGEETPSYIDLERLAYEIYKRPLAIFFFPEPPEEETIENSFRTLPGSITRNLPPKIHFLLREASVMQLNLDELFDEQNPYPDKIINNFNLTLGTDIKLITKDIRDYLGISLKTQEKFKSGAEALKAWRNSIEEKGIFIFKSPFHHKQFSGFCLFDEEFPIIYINNSTSKYRQIFTLFHELAHLLFGISGIDRIDNRYINLIQGSNRQIEIFCNAFAGEILVPEDSFEEKINHREINEALVSALSNSYQVSHEVILRKLIDRELISQEFYEEISDHQNSLSDKKTGDGGNYYHNQYTYLSKSYLNEAFHQYYQNKITHQQLADFLNVKEKNIPGLERLVLAG